MSYREEIDKYHGMPYGAKPKSLEQVLGRKAGNIDSNSSALEDAAR